MENCSFSGMPDECHLKHFSKQSGIRNVNSKNERIILHLRTSLSASAIQTICNHHEELHLKKYVLKQRNCCNPFSLHDTVRNNGLKCISFECYITYKDRVNGLIPGQKLCVQCYSFLKKHREKELLIPNEIEQSNESPITSSVNSSQEPGCSFSQTSPFQGMSDITLETVNSALGLLGESPLKRQGVNPKSKSGIIKKKCESAVRSIKRKLEESLGVDGEDNLNEVDLKLKEHKKYETILSELKDKFNSENTSYKEKLQILTLTPFGINRTMKEFNTTKYLVRKSRELKFENGILGVPDYQNKGCKINSDCKQLVLNFYESDEYSRLTPGVKDCVSVRNDISGEKEYKQKRLLLLNLKELYQKYKEEHNAAIGFSTFCSLRPSWCILAGPKGTHSVCVCTYHQNLKLKLASIPSNHMSFSLADIMSLTVCNINSLNCMMRFCKLCPGKNGIMNNPDLLRIFDEVDRVEYKQWVSTDKTNLMTIVETSEDFLQSLALKTEELTRHHFTAKSQSAYLKHRKENIDTETCIILGDFAENYSFVIQDEVQGYHWENSQATVHPFVIYHRDAVEEPLRNLNYCVISDTRNHSTNTVYTFLSKLLKLLKEKIPRLKKVIYFTDGCAAQYKNRFNFVNLCHHKNDFGLDCEWNFFATSHGKGPCDGIGGTVKRKTAKTSLQRPISGQILTPQDMFNFCEKSFNNIEFIYVSDGEVKETSDLLKERFSRTKTIKGTQRYHKFIPVDENTLKVSFLSEMDEMKFFSISTTSVEIETETEKETFVEGEFLAAVYDKKFYIGKVLDYSMEFEDVFITFMYPANTSNHLYWPKKMDRCWVPLENVIGKIQCPSLIDQIGSKYCLKKEDSSKIEQAYFMYVSK